MTNDEAIVLRKTVIGDKGHPDDFTVVWRDLTIGRILKRSGVRSWIVRRIKETANSTIRHLTTSASSTATNFGSSPSRSITGNFTGKFTIPEGQETILEQETAVPQRLFGHSLLKLTGKIFRGTANLLAGTGNFICKHRRTRFSVHTAAITCSSKSCE
jgi:hypothetical protein